MKRHQTATFCGKALEENDSQEIHPQTPEKHGTIDEFVDDDMQINYDSDPWNPPPGPPNKPTISRMEVEGVDEEVVGTVVVQMEDLLMDTGADDESSDASGKYQFMEDKVKQSGDESLAGSTSSDEGEADSAPLPPESPDSGGNSPETTGPDTWIRGQFIEYCDMAHRTFIPFTQDQIRSIKLLHLLKAKNAPMNSYEAVMHWHVKEANKLREHQPLSDYTGHIARKTIMKTLIRRYNYANKLPLQKTVRLPSSGTVVKITCHDAKATFQRLLTDPRIRAKDYLFFGGDPLAKPPENRDIIADLNTGNAFFQTYNVLIKGENEQIMPVVLYSDGTAVSHFHDMEIIQVNMALGIMTREARNKGHCWAPLGYVEKVHEQGGRSRTILDEANHLETQDGENSVDSSGTAVIETDAVGSGAIQDFHAMMAVILEDFIGIQRTGFLWDHQDPVKNKVTTDIKYEVFVPFVRADTKEADAFCGKYGQRLSAQQICRKCHIPLAVCDDHLAKYPFKTVREIHKLVLKQDYDGLKAISQTYLTNAFHDVRFSMGNDHGIHGSCPSELLHAFLLGTFKYLRDIFFEYIGKDSEGARMVNALSKVYSKFFARQSDRTMPGTTFTKGIQVGKLMGKDYRGVLLIILAILRSTKGRAVLRKYKNFKLESSLMDWILLVETLLTWESYLNEPQMERKHVIRLEKKHRYIMYLMRKIAQRNKGMGLKLAKFHMILHLWEDIMEFGVPLETDTSANESMHKPSKKASKMTQRAAATFNFQTAMRLIEFELLDLAMEEILNGNVPWNYYTRCEKPEDPLPATNQSETAENTTGDARIVIYENEKGNTTFKVVTRSDFKDQIRMNRDLMHFLCGLQDLVLAHIPSESLPIFTVHERQGQTFRSHPNFRGKGPWKDWVWVDWGSEWGLMACHIWAFVVLENMPTGRNRLQYGGIKLSDGTFAVVECSRVEELDQFGYDECGVKSELMAAIRKEVTLEDDGTQLERTFYLADTDAFTEPCCVIPDIGGPANRYFVVKPRNSWAEQFVKWVDEPHKDDKMDVLDDIVVDEKVIAKLDGET